MDGPVGDAIGGAMGAAASRPEYILELRDADGRLAIRHRIRGGTVLIGRGYGADLVVEDPYLCASHARVVVDDEGVRVENLSEVNGVVNASGTRVEEVLLSGDQVLRLGATSLRVRTAEEPVPAARLYDPSARSVGGEPHRTALVALAALLGLTLAETWAGTVQRLEWEDALVMLASIGIGASVWAGLWAFASRVFRKQAYFFDHLRIICLALVAVFFWDMLSSWILFWGAADGAATTLDLLAGAIIAATTLYAHLKRAARRPPRIFAVCVAVIIIALGLVTQHSSRDDFRYYPAHLSDLKPLPPSWLPTSSLDEVLGKAEGLRVALDEEVREALEEREEKRAERALEGEGDEPE